MTLNKQRNYLFIRKNNRLAQEIAAAPEEPNRNINVGLNRPENSRKCLRVNMLGSKKLAMEFKDVDSPE